MKVKFMSNVAASSLIASVKRLSLGFLYCAISAAVVSLPVSAQVSGGTISGTVTDPNGSVIEGAQVKITERATSLSKTLSTTSSGLFSDPNIAPGTYEVLV